MHGNQGLKRKTDENGQLPLLCGVHDDHICSIHKIPMQLIRERRSRGGQERVRYRCPMCESLRAMDLPGLIKRLEAGDWPTRLGKVQRELLPTHLVERFDAVMDERETIRRKKKSEVDNFRKRLRQFGISEEKHQLMVQEQDSCCAICGKTAEDPKSLHIDHCHEHGHVRGLLCSQCNTGLGHFSDNVVALENAARYLRERGAA